MFFLVCTSVCNFKAGILCPHVWRNGTAATGAHRKFPVTGEFCLIIIIIFILFHRSTHGTQPQDIEHVQLHAVLNYMIQIINI
jgi:hypothetical protein